jgi:hypothetical protein
MNVTANQQHSKVGPGSMPRVLELFPLTSSQTAWQNDATRLFSFPLHAHWHWYGWWSMVHIYADFLFLQLEYKLANKKLIHSARLRVQRQMVSSRTSKSCYLAENKSVWWSCIPWLFTSSTTLSLIWIPVLFYFFFFNHCHAQTSGVVITLPQYLEISRPLIKKIQLWLHHPPPPIKLIFFKCNIFLLISEIFLLKRKVYWKEREYLI